MWKKLGISFLFFVFSNSVFSQMYVFCHTEIVNLTGNNNCEVKSIDISCNNYKDRILGQTGASEFYFYTIPEEINITISYITQNKCFNKPSSWSLSLTPEYLCKNNYFMMKKDDTHSANVYICMVPIIKKIHLVNDRFLNVEKEEDKNLKLMVELGKKVKMSGERVIISVKHNNEIKTMESYINDEYIISLKFEALKSLFNEVYLGKEFRVQIVQIIDYPNFFVEFPSNVISFYYLPALKINSIDITHPKCYGKNGSATISIGGLPNVQPDDYISYLYTIYRYVSKKDPATSVNDIRKVDREIKYNDSTYYFSTAYKSGSGISLSGSITIDTIIPGVYKLIVYSHKLGDHDSIYYYPADTIFEVKAPEQFIPKISYVDSFFYNQNIYRARTGSATGTIKITASGGTKPYYYKINDNTPVEFNTNIKFLTLETNKGNIIEVYDKNGCGKQNFNVLLNTPPDIDTASFNVIPMSCNVSDSNYFPNGKVKFKLKGGIPPYRIKTNTGNWSLLEYYYSEIKKDIEILKNYFNEDPNLKDFFNYFENLWLIFGNENNIRGYIYYYIMPKCNDSYTISDLLNNLTNFENAHYIYKDVTSENEEVFFDIPKGGLYSFEIIDKTNGKTFLYKKTISEPDKLEIKFLKIDTIKCFNDKAKVTIKTDNKNIQYCWQDCSSGTMNFKNDSVIDNLNPLSEYKFYIRRKIYDDKYCYSKSYKHKMPSAPLPISFKKIDSLVASCYNAENGMINIEINGGRPKNYGYDIAIKDLYFSTKDFKFFKSVLKPGNYTIEVRDSLCPQIFNYNFKINKTTDSLRFKTTEIFTESNICENRLYNKPPTGKINLAIIPGNRSSGYFKYELFDNNYERKATVNSTNSFQEFKNLAHGDYKVIVTDDSTRCKIEQTFKIDLNKNQISWRGDTIRTLPASCNEIPDGVLKAYIRGGFPSINGYSYVLKRNGYEIASIKNNDSVVIGALYSGKDYELLAIDDSACYVKLSNISIPSKPSDIYFPIVEKEDQWCDEVNGSIKLKAATITGKYIDTIFITYPWSNKRIFLAKGDSVKLENLKAYDNPYIFTAKENIGCTNSIPVIIKNLKNNPIAKIVEVDSTACSNATNGKAVVAVKQAIYNGKYKYCLNENIIFADTAQFKDLKSANYKLMIEDNVGCKYDTNIFIPVIKNPLKIAKIEIIPSNCIHSANGKVILSATGSIQPEPQYKWTIKNNRNNWTDSLIGSNVIFKNLAVGGPYLVYLKDKYRCEDISLPFNVLFAKDTIKLVAENIINPACPGEKSGVISVKTLNGYNDGLYYTLYDFNTGILLRQYTGDNIWRIDSLRQGNYRITVKDSVNCITSIVTSINDPGPIDYNIVHNFIARKGDATGKASILATGGNNRYIVEWYKGINPVIENLIHDTITSNISSISGLKAGNYFVRVSDTARCRFWDDEWLEKRFIILEPEKELTLTLKEIKPVTCYGESNGKFVLKGEGGWGNYYYGYDTINMSKNNVFDNLKAGIYKFYIKDTAGVFSSAYFKMTEPDILVASVVDIKDAKCYGVADGEVILDIRGGNNIYYISDDKIKWQRGNIAKNLKAGSYPLFIKDTLNCSTEVFVTINQPTPIVITDTLIRQTRCGKNDGFIRVKIDGGTPGYAYQWYDSVRNTFLDGNDSLQNVYSGPYRLIVKDNNNCISNFILYVSDITDLSLDSVKTEPVSCWGGSDGKALLFVNKGFPPYEIIWPDGRKGAFIDGLKRGRYMLSITDQEGCKIYPYVDIPSFDSIWVEPLSINLPTCKGLTDGSIEIIAKGGAGDYIYEWSTGKKKNILNGLDAGEYYVKITDKNNCQRDFRFYLPYADTIKTILPTYVTLCKSNDYILDPGKFSKYYWYCNNKYVSSEKNLVVNEPGFYSVEVEDYRGCYTSDTVVVATSQTELEARFLAATQINLNDTIIVFETSVPVPDSIKFIVPKEFRVIEKGPYYQYLVPLDTGKYDLALISYYKDCQDIVYKSIIVSPPIPKENNLKSSDNSIFRLVKLYPNPNDGNFIVEIELKEKANAILRLLSFGEGKIISIKHLKGANYYTENYQMNNLMPGIYLLNVEVNKEMKNFKIIVK